MSKDPALRGIGQKDGLKIWRINKFKLEEVPLKEYGAFYEGDSYIILATRNNASSWNVHFWLGKHSTTVQQHESSLFLSYFKGNIRYLAGGHDQGYHHVEDIFTNFKPVLYRCKGKRNVRCTQVACDKKSLNLGDVFILDLGKDIFVWMPSDSGRLERIKGMEHAKNIADVERGGRSEVHILDDTWKSEIRFWKNFEGKTALDSITKAKNDDENYWQRDKEDATLWRISDSSGKATATKIAQGDKINQKILDTNDAFILDAVNGGIYAWVGKGCSQEERAKAFVWAASFLDRQHLPIWTSVTRVLESAEPADFTQWFSDWQGAKKTKEFKPRLFQCSNEKGHLIVEEIIDYTQESLDGDDVMILDAVNTIYVWVGAGANKEEKQHAEQTAQDYLKNNTIKRHSKTKIDTIFQGQETPTFKKFFPGWDENLFKNDSRSYKNMRKLLFK